MNFCRSHQIAHIFLLDQKKNNNNKNPWIYRTETADILKKRLVDFERFGFQIYTSTSIHIVILDSQAQSTLSFRLNFNLDLFLPELDHQMSSFNSFSDFETLEKLLMSTKLQFYL